MAQWDQAIAPCQKALAANPKKFNTRFDLVAAYAWLGREAEAKAELAEALKQVPGVTVKGALAFARQFSNNPVFLQRVERLAEGWLKAGLPEQ